jgi:hypothetical protein
LGTNENLVLAVTALSGGLAGAVLTQVVVWLGEYLRRPVLEINASAAIPGCVAATPAIREQDGKKNVGLQQSLRVQVSNAGRTTAQSVNVCATEISFSPAGGGKTVHFGEEVVDLVLALAGRTEFALGPKSFRFVDLFYAEQFDDEISPRFALAITPLRFALLGLRDGTYSMLIMATASDVSAVRYRVDWTWDGKVPGIKIKGIRQVS